MRVFTVANVKEIKCTNIKFTVEAFYKGKDTKRGFSTPKPNFSYLCPSICATVKAVLRPVSCTMLQLYLVLHMPPCIAMPTKNIKNNYSSSFNLNQI